MNHDCPNDNTPTLLDRLYKHGTQYSEIYKRMCQIEPNIMRQLSNDMQELFIEYSELCVEIISIAMEKEFREGYKMGLEKRRRFSDLSLDQ